MTFGSLVIVFIIFILAGLFILRPFLVGTELSSRSSSSVYDSLIAERERLLSSIEELDLELELNKISTQEHSRNRDILLAEAAEVIRQLDKGQKSSKPKKTSSPAGPQDDLEKMIAKRRKELKAEKSRSCSNCGKPVKASDKFCSHCGESL
jgi:hypothetical protein